MRRMQIRDPRPRRISDLRWVRLCAAIIGSLILMAADPARAFSRIDRGQWKRTAADLLSVATALNAYAASTGGGSYPESQTIDDVALHLEPSFIRILPRTDGWRQQLRYRSNGRRFVVYSTGADGHVDPGTENRIAALLQAPPGSVAGAGERFLEDDLLCSPEGLHGPAHVGWYRDPWNDPVRRAAVAIVMLPSAIVLLVAALGAVPLMVVCLSRSVLRTSADVDRVQAGVKRFRRSGRWLKPLLGTTFVVPMLTVGMVMDFSYAGDQLLAIMVVAILPLLVAWTAAVRCLVRTSAQGLELRRRLDAVRRGAPSSFLHWVLGQSDR